LLFKLLRTVQFGQEVLVLFVHLANILSCELGHIPLVLLVGALLYLRGEPIDVFGVVGTLEGTVPGLPAIVAELIVLQRPIEGRQFPQLELLVLVEGVVHGAQ